MRYTTIRTLSRSLLGLILMASLVAAQAQVVQIEMPLPSGNKVQAVQQLRTILTNMGGQINIDRPQGGSVGATFGGGHSIVAVAAIYPQGTTLIIVTCSGDSLAQAQERCNTVKRQFRP